jgi:hypothetical protein
MGSITIQYPDEIASDLLKAFAFRLGTSVPTTNAAKQEMAERVLKLAAKQLLLDYKERQAADAARTNASDPAVTW